MKVCESAHRLRNPREGAGYEFLFFGELFDTFSRCDGDPPYRAFVPSLETQKIVLTL